MHAKLLTSCYVIQTITTLFLPSISLNSSLKGIGNEKNGQETREK